MRTEPRKATRAAAALFLFFAPLSLSSVAAPIDDLCAAAENGDSAAAQTALDNGADANQGGCANFAAAPLHRAVWAGSLEVARLLVAAGANVNARQTDGATPLHIAIANTRRVSPAGMRVNTADIVQYLLAQNANPNAQDNNGATPLLTGLEYVYLNAAAFDALLKNGADADLANARKISPLLRAGTRDNNARAYTEKLLRAGANPNQPGPGGLTALHFAAQRGDAGMVALLLENGANIHAEDDAGKTAAQLTEDESILETLRMRGACEEGLRWNAEATRCVVPPPPPPPPPPSPPPTVEVPDENPDTNGVDESGVAGGGNAGGSAGEGGSGGGVGAVVAGGILALGAAWFLTDDANDSDAFSFSPRAFYERDNDGVEFSGFGGRLTWRGDDGRLFWEATDSDGNLSYEFGGMAAVGPALRIRGSARVADGHPEWLAATEWRGTHGFGFRIANTSGRDFAFWTIGAENIRIHGRWRARLLADAEKLPRRWRGKLRADAEILF